MYHICDIENDIALHKPLHTLTYIHPSYIYTLHIHMQICRLVDSNSVHCSPLPLNYINDKIYSCVQFLSSTSLTQTKKNFCEPKLKKKKRMKLVNKQTSETK